MQDLYKGFDHAHEVQQRELLKASGEGKTGAKTIIMTSIQHSAEKVAQVLIIVDGIIPGIADFKERLSEHATYRISTNRSRSNSLVNDLWNENIAEESVPSKGFHSVPKHITLVNVLPLSGDVHLEPVDLAKYKVLSVITNMEAKSLCYNLPDTVQIEIHGDPPMITISVKAVSGGSERVMGVAKGSFAPIEV